MELVAVGRLVAGKRRLCVETSRSRVMKPAVPLLSATPDTEEDTKEQQEAQYSTTRNDIRKVRLDLLAQWLVVVWVLVDSREDASREELEAGRVVDTV